MKILGLKQGTLPSYTWAPHSFWDTQRNPRALKNKTKYYWADWFLRSLWASMKPIIPRVQKKALKNTLRFGEFRKPASQRPSKKLSCGKYSWWIWEVIFFFLPENAVGAEKKKQYWINYITGKEEYSKCWMFPADVSAILQNSLIPITAWVLETNVKYFFLDSSSWNWESKNVDYLYLQGNIVIYGAKLAITASFLKASHFSASFHGIFLFLKIHSYFQVN